MRVHELAKELGLSSKELLEKLRAKGVDAKSHMTALDDAAVALMRTPAPPPAPPAPTAPRPRTAKPAAPPPPRPPEKKEPPPAKKAPPRAEEPKAPPPPPKEKPEKPAALAVVGPNVIIVRGPIVVKELAERLGLRPNQLIAELMMMNVLASINERIDLKVAQKIAEKHGFTMEHEKKPTEVRPIPRKAEEEEPEERPEDLEPRPPVVTFLGHVDHGKTSLLDKIRNASVAKGEFGGITQHIGAYTVQMESRRITFLDTPGHQAFTAMRARGANLTDIAVIVIAADDGVMPQTIEAIKHAQAAEVPIMVAINKMDLPAANPDRVKQQLGAMNLTPEDWGGNVICCPVSATTGQGINDLLEMILLQADMLELKANPKARARGYVIEARLEAGMGPVANLLVVNGMLSVGDAVLCSQYWGRVRALINDHGVKVKSAGPATPIQCLGLSGVPSAGAEFRVLLNERAARSLAEERAAQIKLEQVSVPKRVSLDNLYQKLKESERLELKLIVKADTQGSLEAIEHALREIKSDKVSLSILLGGVGNITANDVLLAKASEAVILGFHVAKDADVSGMAKREGVDIRLHSIIYELLDEVRDAMAGMLAPLIREKILGHLEIKQVFAISKGGKAAGCVVKDGRVTSRANARVVRGGDVIYNGSIVSLRRFQNDVSEVAQGQECGLRLDNFTEFAAEDTIEAYETEKIPQKL